MEFYQWLLRGNGFRVSSTGFFAWVEPTLHAVRACLVADHTPEPGKDFDYCAFQRALLSHLDK